MSSIDAFIEYLNGFNENPSDEELMVILQNCDRYMYPIIKVPKKGDYIYITKSYLMEYKYNFKVGELFKISQVQTRKESYGTRIVLFVSNGVFSTYIGFNNDYFKLLDLDNKDDQVKFKLGNSMNENLKARDNELKAQIAYNLSRM